MPYTPRRRAPCPDTLYDRELAREFANPSLEVRLLRHNDAQFENLMARNLALWEEIVALRGGFESASGEFLSDIGRRRTLLKHLRERRRSVLDRLNDNVRAARVLH